MKFIQSISLALLVLFMVSCVSEQQDGKNEDQQGKAVNFEDTLPGEWVRKGPGGMASLIFKKNNRVEIDMKQDGQVDVVSEYTLNGTTLEIKDIEGQTCPGTGKYEVKLGQYYFGIDLVADSCFGRVRSIMGFWTRPDFADIIVNLDEAIEKTNNPELILERARVYVAIGKAPEAKADFEAYIKIDSSDAYVFMNLAGTCFPHDLQGVVENCSKAVALDPTDKNSYFMRGMARYDLGQHEEACDDVQRAIELGFDFLRPAFESRCNAVWDKDTGEE